MSRRTKMLTLGSGVFTLFVAVILVGMGKYATHVPVPPSSRTAIPSHGAGSTPQFPLSVHPDREVIIEDPMVQVFFEQHFAARERTLSAHADWLQYALSRLSLSSVYQNLASVSSRILVIQSGERKEQVAYNFKKILGWSTEQQETFLRLVTEKEPFAAEGKFYPGTYTVARRATPEDVATMINERFEDEVLVHYGTEIQEAVPLEQALIVASLLEREAYDFTDMRHISGVIWNRLFADMRLQIDATLQYAKGSDPREPWWPRVVPEDKYIASPYNTYKIGGLPPSAIANPSAAAILAALNPTETTCMYYFHDTDAAFHCTETYEDHVRLLKEYYGKGK